jgi:hypothetical protein
VIDNGAGSGGSVNFGRKFRRLADGKVSGQSSTTGGLGKVPEASTGDEIGYPEDIQLIEDVVWDFGSITPVRRGPLRTVRIVLHGCGPSSVGRGFAVASTSREDARHKLCPILEISPKSPSDGVGCGDALPSPQGGH